LRPTLSIVVPSHNRPDLLRRCLASVRRHAPAEAEIVVVDDASAAGIASRVAASVARVHVVRLTRRGGFCVAANAGLRAARGEIVELLNDDTEVTSGWAEAALAVFADPAVAAVAPLVLSHADGTIDSAGDRYYLGGVAGKRGRGERLGPEHLRAGPVFGASASSAFYRRDAIIQVGGFPESFGAYFEDVDLSFRLHWAGWRVMFEPASRVYHEVGASHRPSRRLLEQQSHNEERVFWRNLPGPMLVRALPGHAAVLVAKAWLRWQEGTLTPFVCGRLRVLGELLALRRHRRWLCNLGKTARPEHWHIEPQFWGQRATGVASPCREACSSP